MRGLLRTPNRRFIFSSLLGTFCLLAISSLLVSCGPKKPQPKAALQPAPPSPVEELEVKVSELEARQQQLKRRRAELESEFAGLQQQQQGLLSLRDQVLETQRQAAERAASMREVEAEALAPEKRAEKAIPAKTLPPEPVVKGKKPYVVHTSSYRNPQLAFKEARRLAGKGYKAYTSEADLGAKGQWNRVLVDRFASADEARSLARRIKDREKLSYAAPMRLPFTVALDGYSDAEKAGKAKKNLEGKGIHCFIAEENASGGTTVYRLMVGAYAKRAEAEAAAKKATAAGASAAVVRP